MGNVLLRVLSDAESMAQLRTPERPNVVGLAKQVRPTLEDYYLHVFGDATSAT